MPEYQKSAPREGSDSTEQYSATDVNQKNRNTKKDKEHQGKPKKDNDTCTHSRARYGENERGTRRAEDYRTFEAELLASQPSTLAFGTFVVLAVEHDRKKPREGWQSRLFYFIRLLKLHPFTAHAKARSARVEVEKVMKTWRHIIPPDRVSESDWHFWFGVSAADAHAEFADAWDKVRHLPGHSPLDNAVELAKRHPLQLYEPLRTTRPEGYETFISIAGWLQVGVGDRNILLPVEELSMLLRVEPMTISRYRRWAKEDGFLEEKKKYKFNGGGGRATEFRFEIDRVPMLKEHAKEWNG